MLGIRKIRENYAGKRHAAIGKICENYLYMTQTTACYSNLQKSVKTLRDRPQYAIDIGEICEILWETYHNAYVYDEIFFMLDLGCLELLNYVTRDT